MVLLGQQFCHKCYYMSKSDNSNFLLFVQYSIFTVFLQLRSCSSCRDVMLNKGNKNYIHMMENVMLGKSHKLLNHEKSIIF